MQKLTSISLLTLALVLSTLAVSATGQQEKDDQAWTKWSKKEAEKILSESPWSQNQTDTDTAEMFFSPTSDPSKSPQPKPPTKTDQERLADGATNQSVNVKYMIRFFSARPVRRALIRLLELKNNPPPEVLEKMHSYANAKATDSIIITLSVQASDQRSERAVMQAINSAVTGTLKNDTYLERNGKRLFLQEYVPPGKDGFGAKFVFSRWQDEKLFIDDKNGDVRFYSKFPSGPKLDRKFKVSEMLYNGELEY